jgi:hypothetical protein
MTDQEHDKAIEDFATIKTDVAHIKRAVDEIKPYCIMVTQHEEKIGVLEKVFNYSAWFGGMMLLGVIAVVLAHLFAR